MRASSRTTSAALLAGISALFLVGCGGGEENTDNRREDGTDGGGLTGFFAPQEGETWKYKVQKELPLEVELSAQDEARRPQRTDSGYLVTFERTRTCQGPRTFNELERTLTAIDISEDGVLLGQELYEISPDGIFFRGWASVGKEGADNLLHQGVKLASPDLVPGQSWLNSGADPTRVFEFRVIEQASLEVPAGTFDALRIQITSTSEGKGLKRTIWFAQNIGIVKEESVYYGPEQTHVRETCELVHFLVPSGTATAGPPYVDTPAELDPLGEFRTEFTTLRDDPRPDEEPSAEEELDQPEALPAEPAEEVEDSPEPEDEPSDADPQDSPADPDSDRS